ncbi:hypothetical protein SMKC004_49960 (plasmid) [Serratia marcescens]|nr:hypothetical protein SMKC004_49960 [Serratia marcescens]
MFVVNMIYPCAVFYQEAACINVANAEQGCFPVFIGSVHISATAKKKLSHFNRFSTG